MNSQQIAPEHLSQLSRSQHVLEWLQSEQARIQGELATIAGQWQREEARLRQFLAQQYGITGPFTLDADSGTVSTPADTSAGSPGDAPNAQPVQ